MSTVKEIEAAISALPQKERQKLVQNLHSILPELDGDAQWQRIIADVRPRPALSQLGDKAQAQLKAKPECFSEIRHSGPFVRNH
jgi:hypothetical protein